LDCGSPLPLFWVITIALLFVVTNAFAITPWSLTINTNNILTVTNAPYNAVGDGVATNTAAIQSAINTATSAGSTNGLAGGVVKIPAGIFLCGPLTMQSSVELQIDGVLRMLPIDKYPIAVATNVTVSYATNLSIVTTNYATNVTWTAANFISANNLTNIAFVGPGAIDGQGLPWWPYANTNGFTRPIMLSLGSNNRQLIQNITLSNSPMFHIAIGGSVNNTVRGVTIRAPSSGASPPSHNTDACDVSGSNTLVQDCDISVGDDNFTCGGGTFDVLLTNNVYGSGHGVSIGSYTDGGVHDITVVNCTFNGTDNGIRIKSDNHLNGTSRGGLVQNINYLNLGMTNVHFPIQVYAYYNLVGTPSGISPNYAATQAVAAVTSYTPIYRDITFSNITATSVNGYPIGIIWARTEMPATNIVFNKVNVTGNRNFNLYNVRGAQFIDCNLQPTTGSNTFALFNASVIVTNSAPTNRLYSFDGLTTNGFGNSFSFYNAAASLKNTNAFDDGPLTLSAGTFTVSNHLTLVPSTVLNFALGTNAATLAVKGNLVLGGTNNFFAGGGFTNGTYTVMTCTGTRSGSVPVIGSAPSGYAYAFDTATAGQVKLVATYIGPPPAAPANLIAVASNAFVALTWSPVAGATNYFVKRANVSGGSYTILGTTSGTNFADASVVSGVPYYYVVSALNTAGEGGNSAEVAVTLPAPELFADIFAGSTLNSSSPVLPAATATSYELISAKGWNPAPALGNGHLIFGIGSTGSGSIELQALFASSPVKLASVGDTLALTVTFTNSAGLLTGSGALGFGLYRSGGNFPVPGGMNGNETGVASPNATGNAQTWLGYFGQLAFTGASSQILTRPPQTGANNNNQDLITTGGSPSFNSPAGSTVGSASAAPSLTLTAGSPYTEVLSFKLTAANTIAITNSFFAGTDTNGTLLSRFGGVASGATFLTNSFDALAVGWRETGNQPTTMDINQFTGAAEMERRQHRDELFSQTRHRERRPLPDGHQHARHELHRCGRDERRGLLLRRHVLQQRRRKHQFIAGQRRAAAFRPAHEFGFGI
jgi:polygalacturonase